MRCEDLQFNLSLYADDVLTHDERGALDQHLARCPLCRQKLADYQELRNSLRVLPRPEMSGEMLNVLRGAVTAQLQTGPSGLSGVFSADVREWLQMRLMPYSVGVAASLFFGFMLLWTLLSAANTSEPTQYASLSKAPILIANANPPRAIDDFSLTASEYATARLAVAGESPSLNPQGALIALTKSLVRGTDLRDNEVVIVADVFGDGLAQIAEVVEPSRDRQAVRELEKALKTDPAYAPFVPANLDQRSDSVRVILKIQSVDVNTHLNRKRR